MLKLTPTSISLYLALVSVCGAALPAQVQVDVPGVNVPNPGARDITIDTNRNTRTLACKSGGGVFVRGNRNTLEVGGSCTVVHIMGNFNTVNIAGRTHLITDGNNNTVTYGDGKTQVSNPGSHNTLTLATR